MSVEEDAAQVEQALMVPRCYHCQKYVTCPPRVRIHSVKTDAIILMSEYLEDVAETGGAMLCRECAHDVHVVDRVRQELGWR